MVRPSRRRGERRSASHRRRQLPPAQPVAVEPSRLLDISHVQDQMTELFDFHAGINGGAAHYLPKVLRRLPVALVALAVAVTGTVVFVSRASGHHRASAAAPVQTTSAP